MQVLAGVGEEVEDFAVLDCEATAGCVGVL